MDEYENLGTHNVKDEIIIYDARTGRRASTFALNSSPVFSDIELQFTSVAGDIMQADDTQKFTYFQLPEAKGYGSGHPKKICHLSAQCRKGILLLGHHQLALSCATCKQAAPYVKSLILQRQMDFPFSTAQDDTCSGWIVVVISNDGT